MGVEPELVLAHLGEEPRPRREDVEPDRPVRRQRIAVGLAQRAGGLGDLDPPLARSCDGLVIAHPDLRAAVRDVHAGRPVGEAHHADNGRVVAHVHDHAERAPARHDRRRLDLDRAEREGLPSQLEVDVRDLALGHSASPDGSRPYVTVLRCARSASGRPHGGGACSPVSVSPSPCSSCPPLVPTQARACGSRPQRSFSPWPRRISPALSGRSGTPAALVRPAPVARPPRHAAGLALVGLPRCSRRSMRSRPQIRRPANVAEVRAFVRGAERYWNPNLRPVGRYEKYPGIDRPARAHVLRRQRWWELAFLDAYRVTHDARDLPRRRARLPLHRRLGLGPGRGRRLVGDAPPATRPPRGSPRRSTPASTSTGSPANAPTSRRRTSSSPGPTGDRGTRSARLYSRNATDDTVLDYVEGLMIGAQLERCEIRHVHGSCARRRAARPGEREGLPARRRLDAGGGHDLPAVHARPLRARQERRLVRPRPRQRRACASRRRARTTGSSSGGGTGGCFPTRLLQPDAGTLALFAWLGGARAPRTTGNA